MLFQKKSAQRDQALNTFYAESLRAIRFDRPLVVVAVRTLPSARPQNTTRNISASFIVSSLRESFRRYDTIARWSNSLFICICPEATLDEGELLAQRCVQLPFVGGACAYNFPEHGRQLIDITSRALRELVDAPPEKHSMGSLTTSSE